MSRTSKHTQINYGTRRLTLRDTREREAYELRATPAGTYGKSECVCITPIDQALTLCTLERHSRSSLAELLSSRYTLARHTLYL